MSSHRSRAIRTVALLGIGTACLRIVVACGGGGNQSMASASLAKDRL
jgi:hypothetical protein